MDFKINRIKHKRPICEQCLPLEKCGVGEAFKETVTSVQMGGLQIFIELDAFSYSSLRGKE